MPPVLCWVLRLVLRDVCRYVMAMNVALKLELPFASE